MEGLIRMWLQVLPLFVFSVAVSDGHLASKRLYEDLLSDYNRLVRPVLNNNDTLYVNLSLKLTQLLEINMKQQVMSTNVWVEQNWFDFQLQWDPKKYDNVDVIFIPADDIWTPDVVLFNNADGIYEPTSMTKALVYYTGEVHWKPPALFKSTCKIDVEFFPYDVQECSLKFASWTYDGAEVDLRCVDKSHSIRPNTTSEPETARFIQVANKPHSNENNTDSSSTNNSSSSLPTSLASYDAQVQPEHSGPGLETVKIGIDLSDFAKSVEFDIISVPAHYKKEYFSGIQNPYPDITFTIKLRRKTLFYTINLIIPIVGNAFLTLLVFYLPSDSCEKVTLSISSLVSLTVFFLLLAEIIPPTSLAVPLLGKYLLFTMLMITLSICCTVGILNIHFRSLNTHVMQPWVRRFFIETLPKYLCMHRPTIKDLQKELRALSKPNKFQFTSCADLDAGDHSLRFLPAPAARSYYGYQGMQSTNTSFDEDQLNKSAFVYNFNQTDQIELPYDTDLGMPSLIFPQLQPRSFPTKRSLSPNASPPTKPAKDPASITYSEDVEQAIHSILTIAEHLKRDDEEKNSQEEWKFIALTLDRFFLILFTAVCVLGTCIIILRAPSLYDLTPAIVS